MSKNAINTDQIAAELYNAAEERRKGWEDDEPVYDTTDNDLEPRQLADKYGQRGDRINTRRIRALDVR